MLSWQEIEAAKAAEAAGTLENEARIQTLPPGYIKGFDLTIDGDTGALTIGAGFADVNGVFVRRNDIHIMTDEDYGTGVLELPSLRYYIYISKESAFWVDVTAPEYQALLYGNYHPDLTYRYIGEFYVGADGKIAIATSLEQNTGQIIVVASSTYKGLKYDRLCDGTRDEVEINAAITYLSETYGGGVVELTEGTFYTGASVVPKVNVALQGRGWGTIIEKNGDFVGINAIGTVCNKITGIILKNFKITRNSADTNDKELMKFEYTDDLLIDNILFYVAYTRGLFILYSDGFLITDCLFNRFKTGGLYCYLSSGIISSCVVNGSSISTDQICMGIRVTSCSDTIVSACKVINMESSVGAVRLLGLFVTGTNNKVDGCFIENLKSTTAAAVCGIWVRSDKQQITNNYVEIITNTDTTSEAFGILTDGDDGLISNNYIVDSSGTGIAVGAAANRNLINSNFCRANGADADIANVNEDNFSNRGTDTMATANSWQEQTGNADTTGQRVLSGKVDVHGDPEFLSEENIGNATLLATTTPALLAFSNGYDGDSAVNFMKQVAADVEPAAWKNLTGLKKHFLYAQLDAGVITYGKTPCDPEYARHFHSTHRFSQHSLLHFEELTNPIDEFADNDACGGGVVWTASGAARSAVQKKFGSYSYLFDGANDYIETTDITDLQRPFTLELWFYTTNNADTQYFVGSKNAYSFAIDFSGASGDRVRLQASSDLASWDIANSVYGVNAISINEFHKTTFEWDGSFYRVYIDGVLEIEVANTTPLSIMTGLQIGNAVTHATAALDGYIDEFRLTVGNCRYGTAHAVETEALTPDAQWFDTQAMKYFEGHPGDWTEKKRLMLGEANADRRVGALLHFNAAADTTDWTKLIDEYGNKWTFGGTARLDTDDNGGGNIAPKFGNRFLWMDGNSDYGSLDLGSDTIGKLDLGKPFTYEVWWYTADNTQDSQTAINLDYSSASNFGLLVRYSATNKFDVYISSDGANWDIASDPDGSDALGIANYTWYKITLEWDGSYYKIYLNGVQVYSKTSSVATCDCRYVVFGTYAAGSRHNGGVDEFRLTIGHNQYGAAHTPETAEFSTEGTIDTCTSHMLRETYETNHASPGKLTLLKESERSTGWDVNINPTTAWTEIDFSLVCPPGTKAVLGLMYIKQTDTTAILCARCSCSYETNVDRTTKYVNQKSANYVFAVPIMFRAEHGIFNIREYSASNEIAEFKFRIHGWYRR